MKSSKVDPIPRLENGDRVTRPEFERRYHQMPNVKKAELIELIVEIAVCRDVPWNVSTYDLHDKLQVYRRHGVREYLVWLVEDKAFRWYVLKEGSYQLQTRDSSGILKSPFFSGLWLDVSALLAGNRQQVLTVLQQGINSPEHKTFVETLTKGNSTL